MAVQAAMIRTICFVLLSVLSVPSRLSGQELLTTNRYGHIGLSRGMSAYTAGAHTLGIAVSGEYSNDFHYAISFIEAPSYVRNRGRGISSLSFGTLNWFLRYGVLTAMDIVALIPLHLQQISPSDGVNDFGQSACVGFGDAEVSCKWQFRSTQVQKCFFNLAVAAALSLPTGNANKSYFFIHPYYFPLVQSEDDNLVRGGKFGSGYPELEGRLVWTFDCTSLQRPLPFEAHVNWAGRWPLSKTLDKVLLINGSLLYKTTNSFHLFAEISSETRWEKITQRTELLSEPLRCTPGFSYTHPAGFFISSGLDYRLSSSAVGLAYTCVDPKTGKTMILKTAVEPAYRVFASIGWSGRPPSADVDRDGIRGKNDACPKAAEDFDAFSDKDGCPDYDNDSDGIVDSVDKCPNQAEDRDGFSDADGCPDPDNDHDEILDSFDKCPQEAEDHDGFMDSDGCPDYDNDQDGIRDDQDSCADVAEDRDGFHDSDGCPEVDNDGDSIADSMDACINEPETANGYSDTDGCPDQSSLPASLSGKKAKEIKRGRVIVKGITFQSGTSLLDSASMMVVDEIFFSLITWPDIKLEIRGHTGGGGDAAFNKKLSFERADAIRKYLIQKGIDQERLKASGMGGEEPIADNATAAGRNINRRMELLRID